MHICLALNSYLIAVDWNWYCMNNLDVLFRAAWLEGAEKYLSLAALANHLYSSYSARAEAQPVGLSWERSSTQIFHPLLDDSKYSKKEILHRKTSSIRLLRSGWSSVDHKALTARYQMAHLIVVGCSCICCLTSLWPTTQWSKALLSYLVIY